MFHRILTLALLVWLALPSLAQQEGLKREMRTVWIATVSNIDWPQTRGTGSTVIAKQKKQLTDMLDGFAATNMNSVCLQVRPMADALYKSSYEPWSSYLTGTRGQDPGWDPLEFAVAECHQRGLECNVWINPYRFSNSSGTDCTTAQDVELKNSGTLMTVGNRVVFNPGLESSRQHLLKVLKEIVTNYNIDGIIFDDYFYPGGGTPTDSTAPDYQLWQDSGTSLSIGDWRRANVNLMVKEVHEMLEQTKPYVKFGIGPAGVAATSKTVATGHGVDPCPVASDWQYDQIYSDPLAWMEAGTIDYISPQLYWKTTHSTNPFGPLTEWWSYVAKHFGIHCYPSQNIYFMASTNTTDDWDEVAAQIGLTRQYNEDGAPGVNFYSAKYINGPTCTGLGDYLRENVFPCKALEPALTWKQKTTYAAPAGLTLTDSTLSWTGVSGNNGLVRYAVYAIPSSVALEQAKSATYGGIKSNYLLNVSYEPAFTLPDSVLTGYYYAVTVVDGWNNEFDPGYLGLPIEDADKVTLLAPVGGVQANWEQLFSWTAATDATYRLQMAEDSTFSRVVADTTGIASDSVILNLDALKSATVYYWRVATIQTGRLDKWSDSATFTTAQRATAPVPELLAPADGTSIDADFVFKVSKVDVNGYELQVSAAQDFAEISYSTTQLTAQGSAMTCEMPVATLGKGTFYWRVLTTAAHCDTGVSLTRSFTVTSIPAGSFEPGYLMKRDVDTYAPLSGFRLTNLWVRSTLSDYGNFSQSDNGMMNRGFAVRDGIIYISGRDEGSSSAGTYLAEYSAATGEHIKDLRLGAAASVSYYPCNDVLTDDAGNLVVTNLLLNIGSTPLRIFQVDTETGEVTCRATLTTSLVTDKPRVDHCGILGDVAAGDFTVFASFSYGTRLARWTVRNGQVAATDVVALQGYSPASATSVGIASRAIPLSEDEVLVNGGGIWPTRYKFSTGAITGSFDGNAACQPEGKQSNGAAAFSMGGTEFVFYASGDYGTTNGFQWTLAQNATGAADFSGMTPLFTFPKRGVGSLNSSTWSAPCTTVAGVTPDTRLLYVYAPGNGLAAYELTPDVAVGDINCDGKIDVADVTALVSMILQCQEATYAADIDGDGILDASDVTSLVNLIL